MGEQQRTEQGTETSKKIAQKSGMKSWLFWIAIVFLLGIFLTQAYVYIFFGTTWLDESDYLYTGSQIFERDLVLYDQIWTRMPPVLFYFYGYSQTLTGPSIEMGRFFAFLATTLLLIFSFFTVKNATKNKFAGLLAVAFIVLNQKALSSYLRATASAPTALMVVLTLWVLTLDFRESIKFPLAFLFASLMLMTRMNTLFFFLLLIAYMFILVQKKIKTTAIAFGISFITIMSIMSKFLMTNWKNALFGIFAPFTIYLYPSLFYTTVNKEPWLVYVYEIFRSVQGLGILAALAVSAIIFFFLNCENKTVKGVVSEMTSKAFFMRHHFMIFLILGFLSIFLPHFWADDTYIFYVMPVLAIITSIGMYEMIKKVDTLVGTLNQSAVKKLMVGFVLGLLLFSLAGFTVLDFSNLLSGDNDIARAKKSGAVIANLTEPDATLFIADNEIAQLLYANRKTFPPMTARYYLFTTDNNTPFIKATNRFNMEILNQHLENESDYVLIQSNRGWLKLNKPPILQNITQRIEEQLQQNYQHIIDIPNALPKRYEYGNATISLYKRIPKMNQDESRKVNKKSVP